MKRDSTTNPTCPKCNYDLAGIIREDGTATCPECGSDLEKYSMVNPISRGDQLAFNCTVILFAPIIVFFVMLSIGWVFKLSWISAGAIPALLLTNAGLLIWFSRFEADKRFWWSNPPPRFTPPLWVFIPLMILFAIACIVGEYFILMFWMWSQVAK